MKSMDQLLNALVTALAGLLTLVTYAHDPRIKSWDGTTIKVEWNGSAYTATCSSSTGSDGSHTVTYPKCELPPVWERDHSCCSMGYDGRTLDMSRDTRAAGGTVAVWRQEVFTITSAKAIGWGIFPD